MRVADLSDLWVSQLRRAKSGESPVQLEQLQRMAVQPPADQEPREARRQEEQGTYVSLQFGHRNITAAGGLALFQQVRRSFDWPCDPLSSSLC